MTDNSIPPHEYHTVQRQVRTVSDGFDAEHAKDVLRNATMRAIITLNEVLDDPSASPSEKINAAHKLIELGHGKQSEMLKITGEKQDVAKLIANAINELKHPQVPEADP